MHADLFWVVHDVFFLSAKMSEKRERRDNSGISRDTLDFQLIKSVDTLWEWNDIESDCNV